MTLLELFSYIETILYLFLAANFLWLALLIYKTRNGALRKHLIWFFTALGWSAFCRSLDTLLQSLVSPVVTDALILIPLLFVTCSLIVFFKFQYDT